MDLEFQMLVRILQQQALYVWKFHTDRKEMQAVFAQEEYCTWQVTEFTTVQK